MAELDLQKKIDDFLGSAFRKFISRDYEEAIRELKAAEMLDGENPEILYNLGVSYCRLGLDKTAIVYFKKVIASRHSYIDALEVKKILAYSLSRLGQIEEAERNVDQVLRTVPSDIVAMNLKAYCLEVQGKHADAINVYEAILALDDKNATACNSIAYILSKTGGDLHKSLRYARIAHGLNSGNPAYLDTLGYVYMQMGQLDLAEKYIGSAMKKAPLSTEIKEHAQQLEMMKKL